MLIKKKADEWETNERIGRSFAYRWYLIKLKLCFFTIRKRMIRYNSYHHFGLFVLIVVLEA